MSNDRAVTIRFPHDLYEQAVAEAAAQDRTVASLVRHALRQHLATLGSGMFNGAPGVIYRNEIHFADPAPAPADHAEEAP